MPASQWSGPSCQTPWDCRAPDLPRYAKRSYCASLVAVVVAWAMRRGDVLWNGGRSIPLGNMWHEPGFSLAEMPDLVGTVALVTGANSGIGRETALQLALANATVILCCRDDAKCSIAAREITAAVAAQGARGEARARRLDLADLRQTAALAAALDQELPALHVLVNNAGAATQFPHTLTVDGVEATFQTNYLGHFLLTTRLLPLLLRSASPSSPARVVHLTSGAHRGAPSEGVPLSLEALNDSNAIGAYARYGMAKLASLVFARELGRRSVNGTLYSNAVHPGVVATNMLRPENFEAMLGPWLGTIAIAAARLRNRFFAYTPQTAALSLLHCAVGNLTHSGKGAAQGELFVPVATSWPSRHPRANDSEFAGQLWEFSEGLIQGALAE